MNDMQIIGLQEATFNITVKLYSVSCGKNSLGIQQKIEIIVELLSTDSKENMVDVF